MSEYAKINDLETTLVEYMKAKIKSNFPNTDITDNSPLMDMLIYPWSTLASQLTTFGTSIESRTNLKNVANLSDEDVDDIGEGNYFIERGLGSKAFGSCTFNFEAISGTQNTMIPEGLSMTTKAGLQFIVTETISLTPAEMYTKWDAPSLTYKVTVPVESVEAGLKYNVLPGDINVITKSFTDYVVTVVNNAAFTGGSDVESNASYLARIQSFYSSRTLETESGYKQQIMEAFPEVNDVAVAGYKDPLMMRDLADSVTIDGVTFNDIHVGGKVDIYVKGTNVLTETFTFEAKSSLLPFAHLPADIDITTLELINTRTLETLVEDVDFLINPSSYPLHDGYGVAFSPDGVYMSVVHGNHPYVTTYKRSGDVFAKLPDPDILPTSNAIGCAYSYDGTYLAITYTEAPYIIIYKRSGDTFTKLPDPNILPTDIGYNATFSQDGVYLAIAQYTSPFVIIYKRSGDVFTKLASPTTLPGGPAYGIAFSPDSVYLSVAVSASPYVVIYKRTGDVFAKLPNPTTLPTYEANGVTFSSDGVYMSVAHNLTPFITTYKRSGDTFTKLPDPDILPANDGYGVAFNSDGTYLSVACNATPSVVVYKRAGDVFTKLPDLDNLPINNGWGVAFSPDSTHMALTSRTMPYITIYKRTNDTFAKLIRPIVSQIANERFYLGCFGGGISEGDTIQMTYNYKENTETFDLTETLNFTIDHAKHLSILKGPFVACISVINETTGASFDVRDGNPNSLTFTLTPSLDAELGNGTEDLIGTSREELVFEPMFKFINGDMISVTYSYIDTIRRIGEFYDSKANRIVTRDVLAKKAQECYFFIELEVKLNEGITGSQTTDGAIFSAVSAFFAGKSMASKIDESDIVNELYQNISTSAIIDYIKMAFKTFHKSTDPNEGFVSGIHDGSFIQLGRIEYPSLHSLEIIYL